MAGEAFEGKLALVEAMGEDNPLGGEGDGLERREESQRKGALNLKGETHLELLQKREALNVQSIVDRVKLNRAYCVEALNALRRKSVSGNLRNRRRERV